MTGKVDPRRQLFLDDTPAPEKSETLSLINKRGDRIVILPWSHFGGCSLGAEEALAVFSYWLVTFKGTRLHELAKIFEERLRKELAAAKRTDKFDQHKRSFEIDEIEIECLVRSRKGGTKTETI